MIDFEKAKSFYMKNYRHDRLYGRGQEYGDTVIMSFLDSIEKLRVGELDCLCISGREHISCKHKFFGENAVIEELFLTDEFNSWPSELFHERQD